jgi:hypothetical protein
MIQTRTKVSIVSTSSFSLPSEVSRPVSAVRGIPSSGSNAAGADRFDAMQQDRLIDKIAFHEACRKDRATLHHQPRDALLGENLENLLQVEPVAALVDAKDLAALFLKDLFGNL